MQTGINRMANTLMELTAKGKFNLRDFHTASF